MKRFPVLISTLFLAAGLLLPQVIMADDDDDYEKDAKYAESSPPTVPHAMQPGETGEACLVCHLEGKHGAPLSPHAVRVDCVQCHVQGEIKTKKKHRKKHD